MDINTFMNQFATEVKTIYHDLCEEKALIEVITTNGSKYKGKICSVETMLYPGGIWFKKWEINEHLIGGYRESDKSKYFIPFSSIHTVECDEEYKKIMEK